MEEKNYIKISGTGIETMPMMYRIEVLMGTEFGDKLFKKIASDENYIISSERTTMTEFILCKTEDVNEWLKNFEDQEEKEIMWQRNCRIDTKLEKYIKEKNFEIKRGNRIHDTVKITNCKLKEERLAKEEEERQKALDLLEEIL